MASRIILIASHEAENPTELSLRQAFLLLEPNLRPPFSFSIPDSQHYSGLNRAILYGVLSEPYLAKTHLKLLHLIVKDGYALFIQLLVKVVDELYVKLVESAKTQLIWVAREMIDVSGVGFDNLLVSLLRQIINGDFSEGNLWLCFELVNIFFDKWDCLLEEEPLVLASGLYRFLRLLPDHCRFISSDAKLEGLKQLEIRFCVRIIKDEFHVCLKIGRDFIRFLQDLVHVPEFRAIWKCLVMNPGEFKTPGFFNISQIYSTRTSNRYILLCISPEMESQLRFLLTYVKLGSQKRHQIWFAKKHLFCGPERETLISDIVRFICSAHHPSNEIIQSDIVPRWAVIGWLLTCCRKHYIEANVKLALFYDWLFFDERMDRIMNIEPAMLLMVYSIPRYVNLTQSLLEFLCFLLDNYDMERKDVIAKGVFSAFSELVKKGVVNTLDVLVSFDGISPSLRGRISLLLSGPIIGSREQSKPINASTASKIVVEKDRDEHIESLVSNLEETIKKSYKKSLIVLEELLMEIVNLDGNEQSNRFISPSALCSKVGKEYELNGYKLFTPLGVILNNPSYDDEKESATSLILRFFIFSRLEKILEMLVFWSRSGLPVGPCLLSYASRLAYEAMMKNELETSSFLQFHINSYNYVKHGRRENCKETMVISMSEIDKKLVPDLVSNAFSAYHHFLTYSENSLSSDILAYSNWKKKKRLKFLFYDIFHHLHDLCVGKEDIIRLLVSLLDQKDLVHIQFEIGSKKLSIFGENVETILLLIKSSVHWDCLEQHKLWNLITSELMVTKVQVEKIILEFFCSGEMEMDICSIAVGGFLTLCNCFGPKPELVGAIMLLPSNISNNMFSGFGAAVLASWAVSNESMLFDSLAGFSENLRGSKIGEEIVINHSTILWLMNYFGAQGMNLNALSNLGAKAMEE